MRVDAKKESQVEARASQERLDLKDNELAEARLESQERLDLKDKDLAEARQELAGTRSALAEMQLKKSEAEVIRMQAMNRVIRLQITVRARTHLQTLSPCRKRRRH